MKYTKESFIEAIRKLKAYKEDLNFYESCKDYQEILENTGISHRVWALQNGFTDFEEHTEWEKLNGLHWVELLLNAPQYSDKCYWEKLTKWSWIRLLTRKPQYANKCDWEEFSSIWNYLLLYQPQLEKYREVNK